MLYTPSLPENALVHVSTGRNHWFASPALTSKATPGAVVMGTCILCAWVAQSPQSVCGLIRTPGRMRASCIRMMLAASAAPSTCQSTRALGNIHLRRHAANHPSAPSRIPTQSNHHQLLPWALHVFEAEDALSGALAPSSPGAVSAPGRP